MLSYFHTDEPARRYTENDKRYVRGENDKVSDTDSGRADNNAKVGKTTESFPIVSPHGADHRDVYLCCSVTTYRYRQAAGGVYLRGSSGSNIPHFKSGG